MRPLFPAGAFQLLNISEGKPMIDAMRAAREQLRKRMADASVKAFGFDVDLGVILAALEELAGRHKTLEASLAAHIAAGAAHGADCECKRCALTRMVAIAAAEAAT